MAMAMVAVEARVSPGANEYPPPPPMRCDSGD